MEVAGFIQANKAGKPRPITRPSGEGPALTVLCVSVKPFLRFFIPCGCTGNGREKLQVFFFPPPAAFVHFKVGEEKNWQSLIHLSLYTANWPN